MPSLGRTYDGRVEPLTPEPGDICTCTHQYQHHTRGTGPCTRHDTYGLPCTCPAMETDAIWSGRDGDLDEDEQE